MIFYNKPAILSTIRPEFSKEIAAPGQQYSAIRRCAVVVGGAGASQNPRSHSAEASAGYSYGSRDSVEDTHTTNPKIGKL